MSKTPITWLELIKMKLSEEKSKGNSPSIGDVTPSAKKEWVQIKEGKHPKYIQGKAQTFGRKKKGNNKSRKANKKAKESEAESEAMESSSNSSKRSSSNRSSNSSKRSSSNSSSSDKPSTNDDIHQLLSEIKLCGKCKKSVDKILKKKGMKVGYNPFYNVTPLPQAGGCGCTVI
jgi:hypothetical protein